MKMIQKAGLLLAALILSGAVLSGMNARVALAGKAGAVRLKKSSLTVGVGADYTERIVVWRGKKKVSQKQISFRSLDRKRAVVNKNGTIQGKKPGRVSIVCIHKETGQKLICRVTVQRYVEEITVGEGYLNFYEIGGKQQIEAALYPKKATVKRLKYISSNPEVVQVDGQGVATCTGEGTATITVQATDAQKSNAMVDVCLVSGFQEPFGISEKQNIPHGKVTAIRCPLRQSQSKLRAVIYMPPGYTPVKQYPVLYLLHGAGDSEVSWTQDGGANYIMDYLYARGLAKEMIVVMPAACAEEELLGDLMSYMAENYSIAAGPANTALAGYSMGGGTALDTGLRHPELFSYLGLFSPAGGYAVKEYLYDRIPDRQSQLFSYPLRGVWLSIGSGDRLVGDATRTARMYFEADRTKQYFAEHGTWYYYYRKKTDTPHSWKEWRNGLYNFARLIF